MADQVRFFGIRHHGPGCARALMHELDAWSPELLLVEGPPEADELVSFASSSGMRPPVALLVYDPTSPANALYYPFAHFSPEWQAMCYALSRNAVFRFMDLPVKHVLPIEARLEGEERDEEGDREVDTERQQQERRADPLGWLSQAAGYDDGESWWEHMVEQRREKQGLFDSLAEAMTVLRREYEPDLNPANRLEACREAYMRRELRNARKRDFRRIAVICGAWHVPALLHPPKVKDDNACLKNLPKTKIEATWIPWTYQRLTYQSGYGAGVRAPGWYAHLFDQYGQPREHVTVAWLARAARHLRAADIDCSSAHLIEAARLGDTLAAMRGRPLTGLQELNEAMTATICMGNPAPLEFIYRNLVADEELGTVPDDTPMVPLQRDLRALQKKLRMKPEAFQKPLRLDLRKPNDLARSHLLHRLQLLEIPWGRKARHHAGKGTFHENWDLQWMPEYEPNVIEAGIWGGTVAKAAAARTIHRALHTDEPAALTGIIDDLILSDLPEALEKAMARLRDLAAVTADVIALMGALPSLVNAGRYGTVRKTDANLLHKITTGMITRICIGLRGACFSLDDQAAASMYKHLIHTHDAIALLESPASREAWLQVLAKVADDTGIHGLVAGRAARLLLEAEAGDDNGGQGASARRMSLAVYPGNEPEAAAAWLEGFLEGSGMILLHDDTLYGLIDEWMMGLGEEHFVNTLPLLRRLFSSFSQAERRGLGALAHGGPVARGSQSASRLDEERADLMDPIIHLILGIEGGAS